jgi:PAS domain S-box-containing protein
MWNAVMHENTGQIDKSLNGSEEPISDFTESYASFNRIINNLQRQYIELKEEFTAQNEKLAEANKRLMELTKLNLAATEFLDSILNSITVGIIAVDREGMVTHFNPAASVLFGISAPEALGHAYREVLPPGDPPDANALRAVETGQAADNAEKELVLPDGTSFYVSVSTAIVHDTEGNPIGAVEVLNDLTKTKKMEQELSRLNTLAALGEMAATIAHEVRNPLAAIGGFAALLKREMDTDDARQKLANKICNGVDNLNNTVTSLLNYTRIDEVRKKDLIYDDFLRRTIEQFRYENTENLRDIEFRLESPQEPDAAPVVLSADPMLMRQLFFNLFTNAIEAGDDVGEISVSYEILPRQQAMGLYGDRVLLELDETVVVTTVIDNGPGIDSEAKDSLFAPFCTTKQGGTGLGLAVVWKVVKAHGGVIVAENAPDGGAKFVLLLPARITRPQAAPSSASE